MDAVPDPTDALDPQVARALGHVRDACLSEPLEVRPELAQLLAGSAPVVPAVRRSARMKSMLAAKLAAAVAAALAATGGLAAASALPAPVQSAVSDVADHLGVSLPSADNPSPEVADDPGTPSTTDPTEPTETTEPTEVTDPPATTTPSTDAPETDGSTPANHGAEVSAVAHDDSNKGCEHGRAVSAVASGRVNDKPCPPHESGDPSEGDGQADPPETTTPTSAPAESPTTGHGHGNSGHGGADRGHGGSDHGDGSDGSGDAGD
jgi:hypothetical protein